MKIYAVQIKMSVLDDQVFLYKTKRAAISSYNNFNNLGERVFLKWFDSKDMNYGSAQEHNIDTPF